MMKSPFSRSVIWLLLVSSLSVTGSLLRAAEEGFVPLLNGKDSAGWYFKLRKDDAELAKRVFAIEDRVIHVFKDLPDDYQLNQGLNDTHGMAYTEKKYSKFIFKFEYKWGKKKLNNFDQYQYDGGFYYHVANDKIWPVGIEYQVRFDHLKNKNHSGDFWANGLEWYCTPENTFLLPQEGGKLKLDHKGEHLALLTENFHGLDDQWNECEIIVMEDQYAIHKLNGQIVNYATKLPFREGVIGLQSETAEVFYRNPRIKEFAEVVPAEEFLKK